MLIALPLLPPNGQKGIQAALHDIRMMAGRLGIFRQVQDLLDYMQTFWVDKISTINLTLHGYPRRTNNNAEAVNRWANVRIGKKCKPLDFIGKLFKNQMKSFIQ